MSQAFEHYRIARELGSGATGTVFEGADERLGMRVAIKVLSAAVASDRESLARFEREARAAAGLRHPHIAHVFFVGRTPDNLPFYAMEYVDGCSLADAIRDRLRISGRQMLAIMRQSAAALEHAAAKGIMHRDVKPGNIMLDREAGVKLVDFGMAKLVEENDLSLTASGVALGTPNYLSPEQARGEASDFRSDMYSLGITFYQLLTGRLPFVAETPVAVVMKHLREPVPDVHLLNRQYPPGLCRTIERMMAKEPGDRFGNYAELLGQLAGVQAAAPTLVSSSLVFCAGCGLNVVAPDGPPVETCGRCGGRLEAPEVEEQFMTVRLTGFTTPDARAKLAAWLRSKGRPAPQVDHMLGHLPQILSPRLAYDTARALQKKLHGIGAVVEVERVAVRKVRLGDDRLPLQMATGDGPATGGRPVPSPLPALTERSATRSRMIVLAGVAALLAALAVAWFLHREPAGEGLSGTAAEPAPAGVEDLGIGPAAGEAAGDTGVRQRELATFSGACRLIGLDVEDRVLSDLGELCERTVEQVASVTGARDAGQLTVRVDGRRDFALMSQLLGIELNAGRDDAYLFARYLEPGQERARAVMTALVARHVARAAAGPGLPLWLEAGFALSVVEGQFPGLFGRGPLLQSIERPFEGTGWSDAFTEKNPRAYAQASALVDHLNVACGPGAPMQLLRHLKQGVPLDDGLKVVCRGDDLSALLTGWFETTRG